MKPMTRLSLGLFTAWALHDAEELLTMAKNTQQILPQLPRWLPIPVTNRIRNEGMSQKHVNTGLAIMAVLVAIVSAQGVRTQGRSALFRGAVLVFGVHGFTHIASTVMMRSYTSGVVTSPVIVIPYWLYARRVLREHGLKDNDPPATRAALSVLPLLFGLHGFVAKMLDR